MAIMECEPPVGSAVCLINCQKIDGVHRKFKHFSSVPWNEKDEKMLACIIFLLKIMLTIHTCCHYMTIVMYCMTVQ